ncbi:MAG: hypothetical protein LBI33_07580 [Propionibacteriaceae bacterium]|jgi:hypothetical protein|nr:hypothetical protein [Propionibacteriaceae bacterium]
MLQIIATVEGQGDRTLAYADTLTTAKILAGDRAGVSLDDDNRITQRAFNGVVQLGTWRADEATCEPGEVLVTWIGPDADTSEPVAEHALTGWIADRLEPLLRRGDPSMLRFGGSVGDWIPSSMLATASAAVRAAVAQAAAVGITTALYAGNDVSLGQNLLAITRPVEPGPVTEPAETVPAG